MDHEEFKKLLPLYLDNELEPDEMEEVRAFIASHPEVKQEIKEIDDSWSMLSEWEDIEPEHGYTSRFWTNLSNQKTLQERIWLGITETLRVRPLTAAFAAVCVLLVVGFFSMRNYISIQEVDVFFASAPDENVELIENIELVENLEIIENLELLEDLDLLEQWDSMES